MCRAICSPMAPSPITPVRFTVASAISHLCRAPCGRRRLIDHPCAAFPPEHHTIIARGGFRRDISFTHVGKHALRLARERLAVAAAARGIEAEDVASLERIVG